MFLPVLKDEKEFFVVFFTSHKCLPQLTFLMKNGFYSTKNFIGVELYTSFYKFVQWKIYRVYLFVSMVRLVQVLLVGTDYRLQPTGKLNSKFNL